ncbi:glutathione S-transferase family protein [Marinomonas ostreistagni]|uniref:glutathione S-transferase family protein n=1 Tax=Marinomonas ostreistagni TaxID=359209 RepID=UPI00194EC2D5|nr:glutathione S-transferase family protein [Marinomonas ostreistagni]MBM6550839.1 glutathione S-transferase family protein [Marinomonas ostreistagni]
MKLIIANKNYSTWSLRGWLALKAFGVPFEEIKLTLFTEAFYDTLAQHTPVQKVPVLIDGDVTVWDSLAIVEYVNEAHLNGAGWPSGMAQRAEARAIVAQMHSGYNALRNEMPMNCRAQRRLQLSNEAQADVQAIATLWQDLRARHSDQGDYLFGAFSMVDAFFAPVAFRFVTYGIELSGEAERYQQTLLNHPAMKEWLADALNETDIIKEDEAGEPV